MKRSKLHLAITTCLLAAVGGFAAFKHKAQYLFPYYYIPPGYSNSGRCVISGGNVEGYCTTTAPGDGPCLINGGPFGSQEGYVTWVNEYTCASPLYITP